MYYVLNTGSSFIRGSIVPLLSSDGWTQQLRTVCFFWSQYGHGEKQDVA